jgi:hypothetical protein
LNLSTRGASVSFGERGAHITLGSAGDRVTVGAPGTGLSWTEKLSRRARWAMLILAGVVALIAFAR